MDIRSFAIAVAFSAVWFGFASSSFAQTPSTCPGDFQGRWFCHDVGMPNDGTDETTYHYTIKSNLDQNRLESFDVVYDYEGPEPTVRWPAKCDAAGVLTSPDGRTFTLEAKKAKDDYIHIYRQLKYETTDQECTRVRADGSVDIPWP